MESAKDDAKLRSGSDGGEAREPLDRVERAETEQARRTDEAGSADRQYADLLARVRELEAENGQLKEQLRKLRAVQAGTMSSRLREALRE